MTKIPTQGLHPLPSDYRDRDTLGIASHVISMEYNGEQTTIFLLDMQEMWKDAISEARQLSQLSARSRVQAE
jgi:hypothetical protein